MNGINEFRSKFKQLLNLRKAKSFDPRKDIGQVERFDVGNWQRGGSWEERNRLSPISGKARDRALHRLGAATKLRRNRHTGEREFLLHRGASQNEIDNANRYGYIFHNSKSSWTPHMHVAERFGKKYGDISNPRKNILSAWVPESQIHHIPKQIGHPHGIGPNYFKDEYEVIVKENHGSQPAHSSEIEDGKSLSDRLKKKFDLNQKDKFGHLIKSYLKLNKSAKDAAKVSDASKNIKSTKLDYDNIKYGPKAINLGNVAHYHTRIGNISYHALKDRGGNTYANAAVLHKPDGQHTLIDVAKRGLSDAIKDPSSKLINSIQSMYKAPDMKMERANMYDHSAQNWEGYNPDLYHELAFAHPSHQISEGVTGANVYGKNMDDLKVVVKPSGLKIPMIASLQNNEKGKHFHDPNFMPPHREAMYHLLADKVFKLGDFVPKTSLFRHPITNELHSAQEYVPYSQQFLENHEQMSKVPHNDLFKLAIMDFVTGNNDRHRLNVIFDQNNKMKLIDNGFSFDYNNIFKAHHPAYARHLIADNAVIPKDVDNWAKSIDYKAMEHYMNEKKVPDSIKEKALARLKFVQNLRPNQTLSYLFNNKEEIKTGKTTEKVVDKLKDMVDTGTKK